ncbi:MAG TPA: 23S rRNA (uridine(2552)-2'-O)-methyltransferase RlmE [Steroidobacteraceae bacterium]|nr:23S rRNA (uridine(2552)-2'-O)-methyltransferase RlmE [Steroidobacteraceae bacterium]
MTRRSKSSGPWLQEHFSDPFVQRAKDEGLRSRAAYKLEEIDRVEKLFSPGAVVVDLGAAPGGWSQYAARKLAGRGNVYALDLLPMDAIAGVNFLQGDFREQPVLDALLGELGGRRVDLVLSDMAPNMSGVDVVDQARVADLEALALDFARQVLGPKGALVMKVFQGAGFQEMLAAARGQFRTVKMRKPKASRQRSSETYLVARAPRAV